MKFQTLIPYPALAALAILGCSEGKDKASAHPTETKSAATDESARSDPKTADDEKAPKEPNTPAAEPPPCGTLVTNAEVKEACGLVVDFGEVPLMGKGEEYRCEVKGMSPENRAHYISFSVMDMEDMDDREIKFKAREGVNRFAGGQKGRYRFSVTEALGDKAPDNQCTEEAVLALAKKMQERLP